MRVLRLSSEKMYLAITYDISNNKARSKIVKILTSYGFRVQKSVFEVEITK
ncbi:MAG: CRISPR-associated endonuclease Cas2 [bacterium]|nr:CRISPR-associated endonuclease Cas2 [bacterium]